MPSESNPVVHVKKPPLPKPVNDGFVIFEVDGYAQLTPEQKTWPVVSSFGQAPKKEIQAPPPPEREES